MLESRDGPYFLKAIPAVLIKEQNLVMGVEHLCESWKADHMICLN